MNAANVKLSQRAGYRTANAARADQQHVACRLSAERVAISTDKSCVIGIFGTQTLSLEQQRVGGAYPAHALAADVGQLRGSLFKGEGNIGATVAVFAQCADSAGKVKVRHPEAIDQVVAYRQVQRLSQALVQVGGLRFGDTFAYQSEFDHTWPAPVPLLAESRSAACVLPLFSAVSVSAARVSASKRCCAVTRTKALDAPSPW